IERLRQHALSSQEDLKELLSAAADEMARLTADFESYEEAVSEAVKDAVKKERAACAVLAEKTGDPTGMAIAAEIRNRPMP
ncbi:MAG: hypothetical protein ABI457_13830, partial [Hyphomicrobium sp.]